jgi:hypothetical protein
MKESLPELLLDGLQPIFHQVVSNAARSRAIEEILIHHDLSAMPPDQRAELIREKTDHYYEYYQTLLNEQVQSRFGK